MKRASQNKKILAFMEQYGTITPKEAEAICGTMRLAARISDLKKQGYEISKTMRYGNGTRWAEYKLEEPSCATNTGRPEEGERYEDIFPSEDITLTF